MCPSSPLTRDGHICPYSPVRVKGRVIKTRWVILMVLRIIHSTLTIIVQLFKSLNYIRTLLRGLCQNPMS